VVRHVDGSPKKYADLTPIPVCSTTSEQSGIEHRCVLAETSIPTPLRFFCPRNSHRYTLDIFIPAHLSFLKAPYQCLSTKYTQQCGSHLPNNTTKPSIPSLSPASPHLQHYLAPPISLCKLDIGDPEIERTSSTGDTTDGAVARTILVESASDSGSLTIGMGIGDIMGTCEVWRGADRSVPFEEVASFVRGCAPSFLSLTFLSLSFLQQHSPSPLAISGLIPARHVYESNASSTYTCQPTFPPGTTRTRT